MLDASLISSLEAVERQLRSSIAKAAAEANSDQLNQLVSWLSDIQRIHGEAAPEQKHVVMMPGRPALKPVRASSLQRHNACKTIRSRKYPVFVREGATLVKVAWSKAENGEYEHKAAKSVVLSLVSLFVSAGRGGKRIVIDKLLPLKDPISGVAIPDYQVYVALAWLRDIKLVSQHGRQGYTVASEDLRDRVESAWTQLSSR